MATVATSTAAGGGAAVSVANERTKVRRTQRHCHVRLLRVRLAEALAHRPALEVERRLALAAPVVSAGLRGEVPDRMAVRRRNVALHAFDTPVARIACTGLAKLNRI